MKKFLLMFLFLLLVLLLSACSPENTTPPTATPITVLNPVLPATPTQTFSCSVINVEPTPAAESQSLLPPITDADFTIGSADAPVTVVEYCDFQSQGCLTMAQTMGEIMRNYDGKIRFVFRPLPLDTLDKSDDSALAALAAEEQGKFWEMYDLLFVNYADWVNLSEGQFKSWLMKEAPGAGIDEEKLSEALKAQGTKDKLQSMYEAAKQLGIPQIPLVTVNGSIQQLYVLDYRNFSDTIGLILLGEKQFTECPPFVIDANKQYIATVETVKGNFVIQLFADKAPLAVNSFVFLAREGWYDGVTFHRVIPGFAAQAGDPSGTGRGSPGYFFENETSDLLFTKPGLVGMANSGPDTNGSQFFITFAPAAHLNGSYTIFGQVISGMDVVEQMTARDPAQGGILPPGDAILHVTIEEK